MVCFEIDFEREHDCMLFWGKDCSGIFLFFNCVVCFGIHFDRKLNGTVCFGVDFDREFDSMAYFGIDFGRELDSMVCYGTDLE